MPKIRREAAQLLVRKKWSTRKVARHFGFNQSTIVRWSKKSKIYGYHDIPTKSSKPHHHPQQLKEELVRKIINLRLTLNRTSEVVHQHLLNEGIEVSLNSVRRTIDRHGLMKKRSPWKRYHPPVDRPYPLKPGDLVQIDAIHIMTGKKSRIYVLVLIDVFSRWVFAEAYERLGALIAVQFVSKAEKQAPFRLSMIQSDHGSEFSQRFVTRIKKPHRYTRIGKPNDNAHIERVNRTLQEECLDKTERTVDALNCALKTYLPYYNCHRLHLGLNLKTPSQINPIYILGQFP
ncbi:MAG: Transposase ISRme5 (Copy b, CMGI-2) [Parcubacteria group bacterium GW2011_GWC1_43_11b]|nr:MAG: Transposase ISRme5 (Copy b, CMGI-2) [Parcubacteria group bacterium GW2011_GWC1_43_11b]